MFDLFGENTTLIIKDNGIKLFVNQENKVLHVFFFDELSQESKRAAIKNLIFDSIYFEFNDGSASYSGAYFSLKKSRSNLFDVNGVVVSNEYSYVS